jgi:hypothetical protein
LTKVANGLELEFNAAVGGVKDCAQKVTEAHRHRESSEASEKRKKKEQEDAEAAAEKQNAELKAAEMLKRSAEATVTALQKQVVCGEGYGSGQCDMIAGRRIREAQGSQGC